MKHQVDKVYVLNEDLSLYLNSHIFQFKCTNCKKQLFTNNIIEGILLSIEDIFHLIINPKSLDPNSLKFNKDDIQFKDTELNEEDCIYHVVKCKQCENTIGKFILATPHHKSFFQDKIIINSKLLSVEQILMSEDEFWEVKVVDFPHILRKVAKNFSNSEKENDNLKKFKDLVKNLYELSRNHTDFLDFKKAVTELNADYSKLTEIAQYLNEEDSKSKII